MDQATRQDMEAAHKALSADPAYQQELPVPKPLPETPDSGWFYDLMSAIGGFFASLALLFQIILVLAVVAVIGYIIFSIARAAYERREEMKALLQKGNKTEDSITEDVRPDEVFSKNLLAEADRLAAEGRFGEAIRLLLQSSIRDMQERIHQKIGVSLTAREIGVMGQMPEPARHALHDIIHAVEINVFAGESVGEPEFRKARLDYETFAFTPEAA